MGLKLTTAQTASELMDLLSNQDGHPVITATKVLTLTRMHLLTDLGPGKQVRIDRDEVVALAAVTRYLADPAEIGDLILRVSVIEPRPDVRYDLQGNPLRTDAGADYSNPIQLGGVEGVWEVSQENADRLVDEKGLLLATSKGYVHPQHVREIVGWDAVANTARRYFHTKRAPKSARKVIGTGLWIDVPAGRESGLLVG